MNNKSEVLLYEDNNDNIKVEVILENENVWLNTESIAKLFSIDRSGIVRHINNIYKDNELIESGTSAKIAHVGNGGKQAYETNYYNLDMIISVGFRVNSKRAIKFRTWANKVLKDYLIKGYNINVDRFKNNGENPYFEELLDKIRDIRSSEKVFWRKILEIYATSIDYDASDEKTISFFKTVQNKMHYAVTNKTAAEIIYNRVDSKKDNIGLTNFKGSIPTRKETEIAKNYLSKEELDALNRLVSAYLDIAEINALDQHAMTMDDWIKELDVFLKMTRKDILNNNGNVSHEEALKKAHKEYDEYMKTHLTQVEKDYLKVMNMEISEMIENYG